MCSLRKLEDIHQSLTLSAEQGGILEFLASAGNVQKINSLVEEIHEALMDYQVCMLNCLSLIMSDFHARLQCNKISTTKVVSSL